MRFRSTFKYATSDFTGISKSSSIKKGRLRLAFSKALAHGNAGKALSLVFELLRKRFTVDSIQCMDSTSGANYKVIFKFT